MLDGDVLLYLDCCCEIDVRKSKEIEKLAKNLEKDLIADCLSISPDKYYCKMDLVKYLNLETEIDKRMHQSGALMFYKCKKTTDFVNNWYSVCCNLFKFTLEFFILLLFFDANLFIHIKYINKYLSIFILIYSNSSTSNSSISISFTFESVLSSQ